MCFSATASFSGAAVTGLAGALTTARIQSPREIPLASVPLIFAVQQSFEGALWLSLQGALPPQYAAGLANSFVFVALAVWPWFIPVAVGLLEPNATRRRWIALLIPAGLGLAIFSAIAIGHHFFEATIVRNSICYAGAYPLPIVSLPLYALCTCAPLFLSTDRSINTLGMIVVAGAAASAAFYYEAFISVWCFFAAAASIAVFFTFEHRHAPSPASRARAP